MGADRSPQRSGTTVGTGRDTAAWAARALAGTSLMIAGPRGSGRSHLLRALAAEIDRRGGTTIVIRPSSALSTVSFGAVHAVAQPDLAFLERGTDHAARVEAVLVVDDVELLDAESAEAIARAVASRRLVAVFALRTARARAIEQQDDAHEVRRRFLDLWVEGLVQRIDLTDLTEEDARAFVEAFPGSRLLDSATRAGLVWRADGSRALLRRLVLEAAKNVEDGRDPLAAVRSIAPHSRIAVALERHVAEVPRADLESLAGILRLPRLEISAATRLFDADSVHALLARGALYADGSIDRRLTANDVIALEAHRRLGAGHVDALVDAAGRRMLEEADEWWSPAIAVTIAQRWHRLGTDRSGETAYSAALRARVALDAAREANDRGDAAHAAAHAARGLRAVDAPSLRFEAALATRPAPAIGGDNGLDAELRRHIARSLAECEDDGSDITTSPSRVLADSRVEQLLAQSSREGALLDWATAVETAGRAVGEPTASAPARLRALVAAGTAEAFAGRWRRALEWYHGAQRMLDARRSPEGLSARDRVAALMFMLAGHQIAGADGADVHARLDRELAATARAGDGAALTVAGAAAAIAYAGSGRAVESRRELTSAMSRTPSAVADHSAMIELGVAEELALAGRIDDARAILAGVDDHGAPLLRRSRLYVQTTVFAAEGRLVDARGTARAAAELTRGRSAAALRIRDLFRLTVLGVASPDEVDELVQLAATSDLPLAADAVLRASARSAAEQNLPVDELRLHALWSREQSTAADADIDARGAATNAGLPDELTAREREIAMMADEGLTNREIARRLFLSVRTVESHVYQARAKVGAASRKELGRLVARGVPREKAGRAPDDGVGAPAGTRDR